MQQMVDNAEDCRGTAWRFAMSATSHTGVQKTSQTPNMLSTLQPAFDAEALVDCFRTCRFMGLCCKEEHKAFWDCFARERVGACSASAAAGLLLAHST